MQPACRPVIANPQGEAIQCTRMDCFTLRLRNDGRDNLNCTLSHTITAGKHRQQRLYYGKNVLLQFIFVIKLYDDEKNE
jgi:hypothetical protein